MEQKLAQLQAKLEADPSIVERLLGMETAEDVQGLFNELGLEFTLEEIDVLKDALVKTMNKEQLGELTDDDLEDVAGGVEPATVVAAIGVTVEAAKFVHTVTRRRW